MSDDLETPAGVSPAGSNLSNMCVASSSRILLCFKAGNVLTSCEEESNWKQRTPRLIRFCGVMTVEGIIAPEYKVQALMIVCACL